jgi:hypothetical protein
MDFYEVIEKRRTIRIFKAPPTEEQLRRIILAGSKAPSGSNRQPWEFILIDDPQITNQKILGLPADYELTCVLKLGVPGEVSAPKRRPDFSWFHKNKF